MIQYLFSILIMMTANLALAKADLNLDNLEIDTNIVDSSSSEKLIPSDALSDEMMELGLIDLNGNATETSALADRRGGQRGGGIGQPGRGPRGGWGRPGRGPRNDGWGRYPRGPHRPMVVCKARNGRGMVFHASGIAPWRVQDRALRQCYNRSRFCHKMGCHPARGRHW